MIDARLRRRIEHDYLELKATGGPRRLTRMARFHRHATMSIAVYGLLIYAERGGFPPQDLLPKLSSGNLPLPKVTHPEAPPLRRSRHVGASVRLCDDCQETLQKRLGFRAPTLRSIQAGEVVERRDVRRRSTQITRASRAISDQVRACSATQAGKCQTARY